MNIIERKNAPKQGKNSATKSSKGHFAAGLQKLAKLRSGKLQHGNVLTKKAPMGGTAPAKSGLTGGPGLTIQATEAQSALNPQQPGKSSKNAQKTGRF